MAKDWNNIILPRIIKWFQFNVLITLIPILASALFRYILDKPVLSIQALPELTIWSAMICSITLGEFIEISNIHRIKSDSSYEIAKGLLFLCVVSSSLISGGIYNIQFLDISTPKLSFLVNTTCITSLIFVVFCFITELFLALKIDFIISSNQKANIP